jgi:acetylornithine deacetylase
MKTARPLAYYITVGRPVTPWRKTREVLHMETHNSESLLAKLVSFDTTSRFSNLELIHFIREYLARHGVDCSLVADRSGAKATLFASIGPIARPGFLLAGHTDVVPVDGQAWTANPFLLDRRDGRLYGRGSADMKGFIASVLAAVPRFVRLPLHTPIHLAFTCDEELGCIGLRHLLEDSGSLPVAASMGIVGEPTSMRLVVAHKGKIAIRVKVRGRQRHRVRLGVDCLHPPPERTEEIAGSLRSAI